MLNTSLHYLMRSFKFIVYFNCIVQCTYIWHNQQLIFPVSDASLTTLVVTSEYMACSEEEKNVTVAHLGNRFFCDF